MLVFWFSLFKKLNLAPLNMLIKSCPTYEILNKQLQLLDTFRKIIAGHDSIYTYLITKDKTQTGAIQMI